MKVLECLQKFYSNFNGDKGQIGKSVKGKPIYFIKVSKTPSPVIVATYSIHAREYLTTLLAIKQIKDFQKHGIIGTIYFIPAVNPDGIEIAQTINPLYKANARKVDLNVNFDADWGQGEKNVFLPNVENYVGQYPFSEPETQALRDFTLYVQPNLTLSYHTKGEEIYWEFDQSNELLIRDKVFANVISRSTGYPLVTVKGSVGGYKDWCIQTLKIPAFTIEVGNDKFSHPLTKKRLKKVYSQNKKVLLDLTEKDLWT